MALIISDFWRCIYGGIHFLQLYSFENGFVDGGRLAQTNHGNARIQCSEYLHWWVKANWWYFHYLSCWMHSSRIHGIWWWGSRKKQPDYRCIWMDTYIQVVFGHCMPAAKMTSLHQVKHNDSWIWKKCNQHYSCFAATLGLWVKTFGLGVKIFQAEVD